MTVVEADGRIVIVDTGLMFPDRRNARNGPGAPPDLSILRDRADDIEAIVLTHGHEDHVGAKVRPPRDRHATGLYGGLLPSAWSAPSCDEHKLRDVPMEELPAGERVKAGPFEIELVHMAHRSRREGRRPAQRCRDRSDHGRLQVRADPGGRDSGRRLQARGAGAGRGPLPLRGLHQRRPPGSGAFGVKRRPGAARGLQPLCGADRGHLVRLERSPGPAGDRCRGPARPPGRLVGRSMRKNFDVASNLGIASAAEGLFISPKEIEDFPERRWS